MNDYHGYPSRHLSSRLLELDCLTTAGPRILSLRYKGSENLLAQVPSIAVETVYGRYHYLGGHRLWHAPEGMPRSYVPDDEGLETAEEIESGLALNGKVEAGTGIRKRIEIRLDSEEAKISLAHTLVNEGLWDVELAPWAITMFRLGGAAILPVQRDDVKLEGLLPDRHLVLWPYSHILDPRLQLEDEFVLVRAAHDLPPLKIGTFNPKGWTAYAVGSVLFRKSFRVDSGGPYPDQNCNAEIYCDERFIELETLGPLHRLAPGHSATLNETWELCDLRDQSFLTEKMRELVSG